MFVKYFGNNALLLSGKSAKVLFNPFHSQKSSGKMPKTECNIVAFSNKEKEDMTSVLGDPYIITYPGEYEVKGILILAYTLNGTNDIVYKLEIDNIQICHMDNIKKTISNKASEDLGYTDILFLPVGKEGLSNTNEMEDIINKMEPKVVIPTKSDKEISKEDITILEKILSTKAEMEESKVAFKKGDFDPEDDKIKLIVIK